MTLSTDYRPSKFSEMIGNKETFDGFEKALTQKTLPHGILLTGETGSGKTTSAIILATSLGTSQDNITKINCSDENGVNTARQIIESMKYPSLDRTPKVFLLDEVQKTSSGFQDALLDPLDNIPNYVYFIFCTTNPEKLSKTLKRRLIQYNMLPPTTEELSEYIQMVASNIDIEMKIPRKIMRKICSSTNNGVGASLSTLQSLIELPTDKWELFLAGNNASTSDIRELAQALLQKKSWTTVAEIIKKQPSEPESIRYAILSYMSSLILNSGKQSDRACLVIEYFTDSWQHLGKAGLVSSCYQIIKGE